MENTLGYFAWQSSIDCLLNVGAAPHKSNALPYLTLTYPWCTPVPHLNNHGSSTTTELAPLVEEHGWPERLLPGPTVGASAFTGLARTVVGQQLSWQVARVIFARVQAACGVRGLALLHCACFALPLVWCMQHRASGSRMQRWVS